MFKEADILVQFQCCMLSDKVYSSVNLLHVVKDTRPKHDERVKVASYVVLV